MVSPQVYDSGGSLALDPSHPVDGTIRFDDSAVYYWEDPMKTWIALFRGINLVGRHAAPYATTPKAFHIVAQGQRSGAAA